MNGTLIPRRLASLLGAAALALGVATWLPASASAAEQLSDVQLAWSITNEVGAGAHFGGCNFLSAGTAGDAGSSRLWTEADGFYAATSGQVKVEKPQTGGGWVAPTWATKCQGADGSPVTAAPATTTGNRVVLSGGTGTMDQAAGTATISWTGSFSVVFYGGMTYWTAANPVLTVNTDGTASLTATASGYEASQGGGTAWVAISPRQVTLADFAGVDLTGVDGELTLQPRYQDVTVTTPSGPVAGAFPQSFVDFQQLTGQSSYWYGTGANKLPLPVAVTWQAGTVTPGTPQVTVSQTVFSEDGSSVVAVQGTGFDPQSSMAVSPPLAPGPSGVYVAFGKFAPTWKPTDMATSAARPTADVKWAVLAADMAKLGGTANGAIELKPDGSFSTTLNVSKAAADSGGVAGGVYGIYTYAGGGARTAAFETFTPVSFEPGIPVTVEVPQAEPPEPPTGEFSWTITSSPAVNLGTADQSGDFFNAAGALPTIVVTDTRSTQAPWTLNGQVTDFVKGTDSFGGERLGWTPTVGSNTVDAVAGDAVAPGVGLKTSRTLAWAAQGHPTGAAELSALLNLSIPTSTPAGQYTGLLTITAVG